MSWTEALLLDVAILLAFVVGVALGFVLSGAFLH